MVHFGISQSAIQRSLAARKSPCCTTRRNVVVENPLPGVRRDVCLECGRRHIIMRAEPGRLGLAGTALG
ncbi:hypothetical protein [Caudoviricetes sp.]|nr:hypothetical protein [Caudoviricetes sp.]UOF79653.1 hypothetical protein [Caudoviricetes sp.]UOF79872.1 hypothetical protein [Bacteriophage sp.]UOF81324.1 hypothetical protein [Caudoviricetes sp.]